MEVTDILNCVASIVGLLVSVIAIIISVNTSKKQTQMDLFNKRYEFYIACDIICGCCISGQPNVMTNRLDLYVPHFSDYTFGSAKFLFDNETATLIETIYQKGIIYRDICCLISKFETEETYDIDLYNQNIKMKNEYCSFFEKSRKELSERMEKYLNLSSRSKFSNNR